jgi:hypothetical protein
VTCGHHTQAGTEPPSAKPLIYGYIRVTDNREDDEVQPLECGLRKLAEAEGFCLLETCYEDQPECYGTRYRLIQEVKQRAGHHLVIPSLDHLCAHSLLREQLVMRLHEAGVWLVEL